MAHTAAAAPTPGPPTSIFGWFDDASDTPAFDPGLSVLCPVCLAQLARPMMTISLSLPGDSRSFFFRAHAACWEQASDEEKTQIESSLIDARAGGVK